MMIDDERMNTAARDDFGNAKDPTGAPFGDLGSLMIYDRNGGVCPVAKPMLDDTPVDDGLMPLLLMAGLLVILKKKKA